MSGGPNKLETGVAPVVGGFLMILIEVFTIVSAFNGLIKERTAGTSSSAH